MLPYRGTFGRPRPSRLSDLALPPAVMPARLDLRPLKAWRYVGVFAPEVMICAAAVRVGPARQCFWAVWDRERGELHERTRLGRAPVELSPGRLRVREEGVEIELALTEGSGIECVCPSGSGYAWTRKQGGLRAEGLVSLAGRRRQLRARAVIDDTAAYYERHTRWLWSAGVGVAADGRDAAWNLVSGVNDPPQGSERTVWLDGVPQEPPPSRFAPDLSAVDGLTFTAEAVREQRQNLLIVRSAYRQPFGSFAGTLLPGVELAEGLGVMEFHDARW